MFIGVCLCLPFFVHVSLFTHVYLCLPLFNRACLLMFIQVYSFSPMLTHVYLCLVAFSLPVTTEMAILKGVVHVTDTPTSRV